MASKTARSRKPTTGKPVRRATAPKLLSGGNPQIPKGYGDEPVQAWIAAAPEWKQEIARWVDGVITRAIPKVRKAVKYNSPLYGAPDRDDWFLSVHCFDRYVKVAFFHGADLEPLPPGSSKQKHVRYLDIHEGDSTDRKQFTSWVKQANELPGEKL